MTFERNEPRTLDEQWKERVAEIGKRNFENEEMLRLGFIKLEDLERLDTLEIRVDAYRASLDELAKTQRELRSTDGRLRELQDMEFLIGNIRARRIERVKAERAERKAAREVERSERNATNAQRRRQQPTFLGRRVSKLLRFEGGDSTKLAQGQLPLLVTFLDIATALTLSPGRLQWLTYERAADPTDHYTRFEIPKRRGGTRLISSPKPALAEAQKWVRANILQPQPVSPAAMAFRPGLSIVENAKRHTGSQVVVRMDLADFFPSISFERVRRFFESLGYNPGVATVLSLLCTDAPRSRVTLDGESSWVVTSERGLPQGACTSPDIANLVARQLDERLLGLSRKAGWTYTRYADDLVFSSSDPDPNVASLLRVVSRIVNDEGFRINSEKSRVMRSPNRQIITGLIVDDDVRLTRQMKRRIRAFLHQCERDGVDAVSERIGRSAQAVARGYLAFVHMVEPEHAGHIRREHSWV